MKKIWLMTAAAAMLLTGCTSDDEDTSLKDQQKKEISFATPVMYGMTRAGGDGVYSPSYTPKTGEINGVYPTTENFMIYAKKYASSSTFSMTTWGTAQHVFGTIEAVTGNGSVDHEEVAYKVAGNGWFTKTPYYFLKDWKYAFAAYSPSKISTDFVTNQTSDITYNNTGLHVSKYTCPEDLSKHIDFMYAKRMVDITKDSPLGHTGNGNDTYDGVNMIFRHALSSVHFRAFVDPEYLKHEKEIYGKDIKTGDFKIKSIKILEVKKDGKFDETITSQTSNLDYAASPAWTGKSANVSPTGYVFLDATSLGGAPVYVKAGDDKRSVSTLSKDETRDIMKLYDGTNNVGTGINTSGITVKGQCGLMIPQTFTAVSGESASGYVEVKWTHTYTMDGKTFTEDNTSNIMINKYSDAWVLGKRYIYNIIFKGNLLYFAPTVEDWVDESKDIVVE